MGTQVLDTGRWTQSKGNRIYLYKQGGKSGRYELVVVNDELAPADWKSPAEVGNVD